MKRAALLLWPILALVTASASPAPASAPARATPGERFRFDAGARLLAPAGVATDGSICVGTVDGYVHGLDSDGTYRWSHTVQGGITRRPLWSGERWLLVAGSDRLYALKPETGALSWVFKSLSAVSSELTAASDGTVYFGAADGFFYGLSARGGVSLRVPFGALKSAPELAADGTIWAENVQGARLGVRGLAVRRYAPNEPSPHAFGDPSVLRDPEGRSWRAHDDGRLELDDAAVPLSSAPLFPPVWSNAAAAAIVSARNGQVFALEPVLFGRRR